MINGVLVENGDRKARIRIKTNGARILRLRDALNSDHSTSPLESAYLAAQKQITGELNSEQAKAIILATINELDRSEAKKMLQIIGPLIDDNDFYGVMRAIFPSHKKPS